MGRQRNSRADVFAAEEKESQLRDDYLLMQIYSCLPPKFKKPSFKCITTSKVALMFDISFRRRLLLAASGIFFQIHLIKFHPTKHRRYLELADDRYIEICDGKWGCYSWNLDICLNFLPRYPHVSIIDSCTGLLLCLSYKDGEEDKLYVCNPLRKRWVALPPRPGKYGGMSNAKLAYDGKLSPHFYIVNQPGSDPPLHCIKLEVFYSGTGKWVKSKWLCEPSWHIPCPRPTCFLNGEAYALSVAAYAMAIDLKLGGRCRGIQLPDGRGHRVSPVLGVSNGHLHCITHDGWVINVWMLIEGSTTEWVLMHNIRVQALAANAALPPCCSFVQGNKHEIFNPLKLHPSMSIIFLGTHCKAFAYDLLNKAVVEVCNWRPGSSSSMSTFSFHPFSPCLNPLEYSQKFD